MTDETDAQTRDEPTPNTRLAGLSRFATDDRSVSEVLGAILIFGLLILLLVLIQVNAVPAANQQVEFEHNQRAQGDMQELQETLLSASSSGREGAVSIEAGVGYPTRLFLINPPRASGTVETTAQGEIRLENARALDGEIDDYLDGNIAKTFESQGIAYRTNYNEYRGAPTTVYENGVLYNNYTGNRSVVQERGAIISGRDISLVTLRGSLSQSSDRSISLGVTPISAPTRTVSVTNDAAGSPLTITVPTRLGPDAWRALLEEELDENGGHITRIRRGTADRNTVVFTLEEGVTYDLRMSAIGMGSGFDTSTEPTYATDIEGNGETVGEGTTERLTVEVRDRYSNPVSDVELSVSTTRADSTVAFLDGNDRTDADGHAVVEYTAPTFSGSTQVSETVTVSFDSSNSVPPRQEQANFTLTVENSDGSGVTTPPPPGSGNPINPGFDLVLNDSALIGGNCNSRSGGNACNVRLTFSNLNTDTGFTILSSRVSFFLGQTPGGSPITPPDIARISDEGNSNYEALAIGGNFTDIDPVTKLDSVSARTAGSPPSTTIERYDIEFRQGGSQLGARQGDLFVIEFLLRADDGRRISVTYFAAPT